MLKIFKGTIGVCLLFVSLNGWSQGQGNSPYSVLGVGEVTEETVAAQDMMGGTGVSFSNSFYINHINPALLVKNRSIGFNKYVAFNVGLKGGYKVMNQNNLIQDDFGFNLNNISMAFPIKPKWAMAISLRPYSIADQVASGSKTFLGSTLKNNYQYQIGGGLSRVAFSNSFQLVKGLYVGIEGHYNFGNILRDSTTSIAGSSEYFRNSSRISLTGHSLKGGLAYQQKLSKKWNLNLGGFYQLGTKLSGENLRIFSVLADAGNGPVHIQSPDTLANVSIASRLPAKFKVGMSLESNYHWIFAADFGLTDWVNTKQFDDVAQKMYKNSTEVNLGMEWIPDVSSSKYFNQVFYRAGFKQIKTPYVINSTQIMDRSFSFGLSVPMGFRNPSYIDLGISIGTRGANTNGLIKENYTKISASFSLLSSWFNKPRID
jgi:hypothetical protein